MFTKLLLLCLLLTACGRSGSADPQPTSRLNALDSRAIATNMQT